MKINSDDDYDINFLLVHINQDPNRSYVGKIIFRGDSRATAEIFTQGFSARGTNLDLINHMGMVTTPQSDSAYVSTSKSQMVAKRFPITFDGKQQEKTFLYEIAMPKNAIDITSLSKCLYRSEQEVAIPHKIESNHIRGAWEIDCSGLEEGFFSTRQLNLQRYLANPNFKVDEKAAKNLLTAEKITKTGHSIGCIFTIVGVALDSIRLYQSFKTSMEQNNFLPFFQESAQIMCGWQGAMVMGALGAETGAAVGAVVGGPAGAAVGSLLGGFVGSGMGYLVGSEAAKQLIDSDLSLSYHNPVSSMSQLSTVFSKNGHSFLPTKKIAEVPTMKQSSQAASLRPLRLDEVRQFDGCTLLYVYTQDEQLLLYPDELENWFVISPRALSQGKPIYAAGRVEIAGGQIISIDDRVVYVTERKPSWLAVVSAFINFGFTEAAGKYKHQSKTEITDKLDAIVKSTSPLKAAKNTQPIDKRLMSLQQSQHKPAFFNVKNSNPNQKTIDGQLAAIAHRQATNPYALLNNEPFGHSNGLSHSTSDNSTNNGSYLAGFFGNAQDNHCDSGMSYSDNGSSHKGGGWCDNNYNGSSSSSDSSDLNGWRVEISFREGDGWSAPSDGRGVLGLN